MCVRRLHVSRSRGDCLLSVQDFELVGSLVHGCSGIGGVQICRPRSEFSRRVRNSADVGSHQGALHFCILANQELLLPRGCFCECCESRSANVALADSSSQSMLFAVLHMLGSAFGGPRWIAAVAPPIAWTAVKLFLLCLFVQIGFCRICRRKAEHVCYTTLVCSFVFFVFSPSLLFNS